MSTHATFRFVDSDGTCYATIYRHSDGYLECGGRDIFRFFDAVREQTGDTRFSDPAYLSAKYVVFLASQFANHYEWNDAGEFVAIPNQPLDFLSVGIIPEGQDHGEEYRYTIHASGDWGSDGHPEVTYQQMTDWSRESGAVWSDPAPLTREACQTKEEVKA
jgi:hypothetical protein